MIGSIVGAAFIVLLPVFKTTFVGLLGWPTDIAGFR